MSGWRNCYAFRPTGFMGLRVVCGGVEGMDSEDSDSDVEPDTGLFHEPWGVVTSGDGALWVADSLNHRLCLFR